MPDWDPKAIRKPVPGVGTGSWDAGKPKGLIHTTEGFTLAAAFGAYKGGGYAPHVTIGPHPDGGERVQRWQHLPFSGRATTISDRSGGIRPNRVRVYQVEVVGTCDDKWKSTAHAWLHVDNWPGWYRDALAELMADWERWFGIPRRSSVRWVSYPSSYGLGAAQRLGAVEFRDYAGWLGHQHAVESTHGDPGDLDIGDLFRRMGGGSRSVVGGWSYLEEVFSLHRPAQLCQVKGKPGIYAVTLTGAVHIKNPYHLECLRKSGQVTDSVWQINEKQLAQLLEKE